MSYDTSFKKFKLQNKKRNKVVKFEFKARIFLRN